VKTCWLQKKRWFQVRWRELRCKPSRDHIFLQSPSEGVLFEVCERCGCWLLKIRGENYAASIGEDLLEFLPMIIKQLEGEGLIVESSELSSIYHQLSAGETTNGGVEQ